MIIITFLDMLYSTIDCYLKQLINLKENIQHNPEDLKFLSKIPSNSMKRSIANQMRNTGRKLNVFDNLSVENKDLPEGYVIEIYNKDDKLVMQIVQGK